MGATDVIEGHITQQDLRSFPQVVAGVVIELVNKHNVRYRMPDGMHLFLYAEDTTVRPYKLACKRSAKATMQYLERWIVANVPGFYPPTVIEKIEDEMSTVTEQVEQDSGKVNGYTAKIKDVPSPGKPLVYSSGSTSVCFVWLTNPDGYEYLECTMCNYHQQTARGAHLHEAKHTGRTAEISSKGNETKQAKAEERKLRLTKERDDAVLAVELLAGFFGIDIQAARDVVDEQQKKIDALIQERDDLKTRLSLVMEALRA